MQLLDAIKRYREAREHRRRVWASERGLPLNKVAYNKQGLLYEKKPSPKQIQAKVSARVKAYAKEWRVPVEQVGFNKLGRIYIKKANAATQIAEAESGRPVWVSTAQKRRARQLKQRIETREAKAWQPPIKD